MVRVPRRARGSDATNCLQGPWWPICGARRPPAGPRKAKAKQARAHSALAPRTATRLQFRRGPARAGPTEEEIGGEERPRGPADATRHRHRIASHRMKREPMPCRSCSAPTARVRGEHARARGVDRISCLVRVAPPPRRSAPAARGGRRPRDSTTSTRCCRIATDRDERRAPAVQVRSY